MLVIQKFLLRVRNIFEPIKWFSAIYVRRTHCTQSLHFPAAL